MSEFANVRSLDAIRQFRVALQKFVEDAQKALAGIQMEIHRGQDWLEHDRPAYWQAQVRLAFQQVAETRTAYESCRMRTVAGHRPACLEERNAYREAQAYLRYAQEKVEAVRLCALKVRHEADEYRGRIGQLERCLEGEIPQTLELLSQIIASLEAYADILPDGELPPAAAQERPPRPASTEELTPPERKGEP